ncbi:hypothetical protein [Lysinibacillus telephonicus]|uniref:hypothetical protein n=1 Tax=Lysinibacillus telephonicus TaxID=1714840 RepID=UPI003B9E069F
MDELEKEYDRIWTEQWVNTFKSVSDGSVDVYTAYLQMTFIVTNYAVLNDDIDKVEGENLSKENKELLKSYKEKLSKSADYRTIVASEAATMFYEGTLNKTSEIENIKGIISTGDGEMMQAMKDRLSIEENLGLIENEQTKE